MSRSAFRHLRVLGPLTVAATLSIGTLPAFAQSAPAASCSTIRFELANPSPGAEIQPGSYVAQGTAMDSRARSGLGIDRIDFFLDSRESGGVNIGTVVPGLAPGPWGASSFQGTISIPNKPGGHDLIGYARSSVNGAESIISIPVAVAKDPSKVFNTEVTATTSCKLGNPAATTTSTTAATQPSTTTTTVPSAAATASTITLNVGNPSPNDTIRTGAYSVQGLAVDSGAKSGPGVDRVDIFLDDRDGGGIFVGTATLLGNTSMWQTIVDLPDNQLGLHSLWFYAHSSVSGQVMGVGVPVTIVR